LFERYDLVIAYKISNILVRAQIQDICSRATTSLEFADDLKSLETLIAKQISKRSLIVCDLAEIFGNEEFQELIDFAKSKDLQILGKYPHVSVELGKRASRAGIHYVVTNSRLKRRLQEILGG